MSNGGYQLLWGLLWGLPMMHAMLMHQEASCAHCAALQEPMIGVFHFQSAKPDAQAASLHQGRCIAHM